MILFCDIRFDVIILGLQYIASFLSFSSLFRRIYWIFNSHTYGAMMRGGWLGGVHRRMVGLLRCNDFKICMILTMNIMFIFIRRNRVFKLALCSMSCR